MRLEKGEFRWLLKVFLVLPKIGAAESPYPYPPENRLARAFPPEACEAIIAEAERQDEWLYDPDSIDTGPNQHYVVWEQGRPYNHGIWNLIEPYVDEISEWAKKPADGVPEPNRDVPESCPSDKANDVWCKSGEYSIFGRRLNWVFFRKYTSSSKSDRFRLKTHTDSTSLSISINLSGDYEGGDLFFVDPTYSQQNYFGTEDYPMPSPDDECCHFIDKEVGAAFKHSGNVNHGVTEMESGTRYSLVFFYDQTYPMSIMGEEGRIDTRVNHAHVVRDEEGRSLVAIKSDGQPRKSNFFVIGQNVACEVYYDSEPVPIPNSVEGVPARLRSQSSASVLHPVLEHISFPMYHVKVEAGVAQRNFFHQVFGTYCGQHLPFAGDGSGSHPGVQICMEISSNYVLNLRIENANSEHSGWCLGNMYEPFFDRIDFDDQDGQVDIEFLHRQPCIEETIRAVEGRAGSLAVAFIPSKKAFSIKFKAAIGDTDGCNQEASQADSEDEQCTPALESSIQVVTTCTKKGCTTFPPALLPSAHPTFADDMRMGAKSASVYAGVSTPDHSDCIHLLQQTADVGQAAAAVKN